MVAHQPQPVKCPCLIGMKRPPSPVRALSDSDADLPLNQTHNSFQRDTPKHVEDLPLKPRKKERAVAKKKPGGSSSGSCPAGSLRPAPAPSPEDSSALAEIAKMDRVKNIKNKKECDAQAHGETDGSELAELESKLAKKKVKAEQATDGKPRYVLMKYNAHGKEGSYAVRVHGGKQFAEVNIPNALLDENKQVADAIQVELNTGVEESKVRELLVMLKTAMVDSIAKRMAEPKE